MKRFSLISLTLSLWLCFFYLDNVARAEPLDNPHGSQPSEARNIGVKECAACHSAPSPIYQHLGVTQFVRLVEAKEWMERDKHAYAYQLVRQEPAFIEKNDRRSNKLSAEITSKLKWSYGDGNFEKKCLTCHVGLSEMSPFPSPNINITFGVQCESCHGPGSEYSKLENHQQVAWRRRTPDQKSELGMWDLSSPSTAAEVCLSCHLGNIAEGRFVTHDMYAAGHPVLPPFDLQVFLNAMTPHWRTLQEKPTFEQQADYYRTHFDIRGNTAEIQSAINGSYDKTRRSMIGGLVTNDISIELIHQGAADPETWGDYSNYNCMGCHQELRKNLPNFRTESRIPGRPFPANWLSLDYPTIHASNQESHEALKRDFLASFNSVPFGDAQRLNQLRERHRQSLVERSQDRRKMERQVMSKTDVLQWLEFLTHSREDSLNDFWVARQTGWMVCVAIDELVERNDIAPELVGKPQKELKDLLRLDLQIPQRESVLVSQSDILATANQFDATRCKALLEVLVKAATSSP